MKIKEVINSVSDVLDTNEVYLVGGAVRNHLLGKGAKDYDFCTILKPEQMVSVLRSKGRKPYTVGSRFGTVGFKVLIGGEYHYVEVTTYRVEEYVMGSRKPKATFINDLREDLLRRDFTVNAMAIDKNMRVYDYFGGREDLKRGIIRCVGFPKHRFKEDPLRILRAVRFAGRYNFTIDNLTKRKMASMKFDLLNVSKERWVQELDLMLISEVPSVSLDILQDLDIMRVVLPEISLQKGFDQNSDHHHFDLWTHTMKVTDAVPQDLNMRWLALLHDIAKPFVVTTNSKGRNNYIGHEFLGAEISLKVSQYLKFSNERRDFLFNNIKSHLQEDSILRSYDNLSKKGYD